jgi:hypothetical protein
MGNMGFICYALFEELQPRRRRAEGKRREIPAANLFDGRMGMNKYINLPATLGRTE